MSAAVIQDDREAAAQLIETYWQGVEHPQMHKLAEAYRAGHSQGVWARAFARHRIASQAELVEALKRLRQGLDLVDPSRPLQYADAMDLMRKFADVAIAKAEGRS